MRSIYFSVIFGAFRQPKFECGCCEMLVFRVCGVRQNFYVFSRYRNPDLDDRIFYCLLAQMAAVQAEDVCTSFPFVGDLNGVRSRILIVSQLLTSRLYLVVISWLSSHTCTWWYS